MTDFNASSFRFFERKVAQGIALSDFSGSLLYHTKNYQGTTTRHRHPRGGTYRIIPYQELPGNYNTADFESLPAFIIPYQELPGNYNFSPEREFMGAIIPYQELPGNYNYVVSPFTAADIIPYQELPGNYNYFDYWASGEVIMPYQELPGNYNASAGRSRAPRHYTIPRTTRELQPRYTARPVLLHYTIPRTTRELQHALSAQEKKRNYTLQGSHGQNSRAAARQFLCCFFRPKWV